MRRIFLEFSKNPSQVVIIVISAVRIETLTMAVGSRRSPTKTLGQIKIASQTRKSLQTERKMQKREQGKSGGSAGGGATPPAKRGRPFGSGNNSSSAAASAADSAAPSTLLGPSLHVHNSFAGKFTTSSSSSIRVTFEFLHTLHWVSSFSFKNEIQFECARILHNTGSKSPLANFKKYFYLL